MIIAKHKRKVKNLSENLEFYIKTLAFLLKLRYTGGVELSFAPVMFGGFMMSRQILLSWKWCECAIMEEKEVWQSFRHWIISGGFDLIN